MKKIILLLLTALSLFTFGQTNKSFDVDRSVKAKPLTYKLPTKPAATLSDYYAAFNSQNLIAPKLYYQQDISPNNITSQQFEAGNTVYSANAADDFEVPAAAIWKIESVSVIGRTEVGSNPDSFNVTFYNNMASNIPGTVIRTENVTLATGATSPTLQLPTPILLTPGKYWVSVQAVMNLSSGQWFWDTYTDTATLGAPFAWTNPGNGFATSCNTTWKTASICFAAQLKDLKFSLNGEAITPCKTFTGRILTTDPTHSPRITRDGVASVCGTAKIYPGDFGSGNFHYKKYTIQNTSPTPECVTITVKNADPVGTNQVHLIAYTGSFNPANISQNYLGDTGSSSLQGITEKMNITIPGNTTVVLVATEPTSNTVFTEDFTISVIAANCGIILKAINTETNNVSIYPNPVNKILYVNGMDIKEAKVFDVSGKSIPVKSSSNQINVSNLSVGTYLLQLQNKEGKMYQDKFIKK